MWQTFVTYSHDDGDLSEDTLASVAVGVDLSGGYLHDEGPVHRQLTLPVYDGLQVDRLSERDLTRLTSLLPWSRPCLCSC